MTNKSAADMSQSSKNQSTSHKSPIKQKVSGVILIDKPKGITSQQVVSKVKYLLKSPVHDSKKAGHTGTLDPMATGLLPVCLGEATKFSHYQLDADKSYQATIKLGIQTDTGDAEGKVIAKKAIPIFESHSLDRVIDQFLGDILQTPPMYSALKKDGKKLYEYARAGIEVKRDARPITIKSLAITQGEHADELIINVTCSKGTYVRVLGEDIAASLDTLGHLTALRRTQVGHFNIDSAISLEEFEQLTLEQRLEQRLDIDACISGVPVLTVSDSQCERLHKGQRLNVIEQFDAKLIDYLKPPTGSSIVNRQDEQATVEQSYDIKLMDRHGNFLGLGKLEANGRLQPKKMIQR